MGLLPGILISLTSSLNPAWQSLMPREDRAAWKSSHFLKSIQFLHDYPRYFIVGGDNVGSKQMQQTGAGGQEHQDVQPIGGMWKRTQLWRNCCLTSRGMWASRSPRRSSLRLGTCCWPITCWLHLCSCHHLE